MSFLSVKIIVLFDVRLLCCLVIYYFFNYSATHLFIYLSINLFHWRKHLWKCLDENQTFHKFNLNVVFPVIPVYSINHFMYIDENWLNVFYLRCGHRKIFKIRLASFHQYNWIGLKHFIRYWRLVNLVESNF